MLIVAHKGREKQIVEIFNKWDLDAVVVGKVVEGNRLKVFHNGVLEADLPVDAVTDEAPKYNRPLSSPKSKVQSPKSKTLDSRLSTLDFAHWARIFRCFVRQFINRQIRHKFAVVKDF
ncbi:MAG: hypothetical protein ACR2MG_02950 [Pyrinomonadaceae bacterium]